MATSMSVSVAAMLPRWRLPEGCGARAAVMTSLAILGSSTLWPRETERMTRLSSARSMSFST